MTAYIVRRLLYSIPILIGVNLFTFFLFFFINTPDDMARVHLGTKNITVEQIAKWKRQRDYHLSYFYNDGWTEIAVRQVQREAVTFKASGLPPGDYVLRFESGSPSPGQLAVSIRADSTASLSGLNLPILLDTAADLPEVPFGLVGPGPFHTITATLTPSAATPGLVARLYQYRELSFVAGFTQTIFWKKSVKFLAFQFGKSDDGRNIGSEILERIGPSLAITIPMFVIGILVNITVAMFLALFRGTYIDFGGVGAAVILMSISALFYIIGGQWLLGKTLRLVPISGYDTGWYAAKFIALPVIIGIIGGIGAGVRLYRTFFLEEIGKDYVRTARAKGLAETVVLFKHVLKNALIPILTGVVVTIPQLILGSLILEPFFAIPGMGSFTLEAIQRQDFAIVQAMVFLGSVVYIIGLLLTDLSYSLVDPRIRFS